MTHLRRLAPYLRRHRRSLTHGLLCLLLTTAFSVASPWVLRRAIDDLTEQVTHQKLLIYSGLIVVLVLVEGVFRYYMRVVLIGVSREIEYEIRNDVFRHLTLLAPRFYTRHRTGDLMSRATNDMSAVRMVLGPGIMYTANTVATSAGALALMARISPRLLVIALLPLVLVSVLVRYFGKRIHDRFEKVQEQLSSITALVQESLSGVRVVRSYAQEAHELRRFEEENQEFLRRNKGLIRMFGSLYPGIQLLMGISAITVLWLGGRMVVARSISLGDFVAFSTYLAMLQWPMIALGWVVNIFERGEASMGRLLEMLDAEPEIRDKDPLAVTSIRGDIEFRGLTFSYEDAPILKSIDLKITAGQTVAIVGPTGSGKSTLVSLIPRLYDAPEGTLFVDGHDVRSLPLGTLRGSIGFVPQETFLFSATVGENVAFGRKENGSLPKDGTVDRKTEWAAEVAQLKKDVVDFPKGFETFVGERGITLSGGQKQRTALARALWVDPRILVLDDALASVDTETEENILTGLRKVREERTTILVSHRISTVKDADLIVVLREGAIAERGSHEELLRLGGFYAELNRRQLLEKEMETA